MGGAAGARRGGAGRGRTGRGGAAGAGRDGDGRDRAEIMRRLAQVVEGPGRSGWGGIGRLTSRQGGEGWGGWCGLSRAGPGWERRFGWRESRRLARVEAEPGRARARRVGAGPSEDENRGAARRCTGGPIRVEHFRQPQAASRRHRHQIAGLIRLVVKKRPAISTLSPSPSSIHIFLAAPSFSMLLPG